MYRIEDKNMFLRDIYPSLDFYISESYAGKKIILRGILQVAEQINANRRVYPKAILEREVERIKEFIKDRRLTGELDHPEDSNRASYPSLAEASHLITGLEWKDNILYGEIEVLPIGKGLILKGLIENGVKVGISARGFGNPVLSEEGYYIVEDYNLITWDIVSFPSFAQANLELKEQEELNKYIKPRRIILP